MKILLAVKSKKMECLGPMHLSAVAKKAAHECGIMEYSQLVIENIAWKPDIIGFSVMTGDQVLVKNLAAGIKSKKKPPMIIVGGHHATFFPKDFEQDDNFNMVIKGEAEQAFAELLGSSAKYPALDSLPWPDRTDFPNYRIRDFIASRGCGSSCSYCYNEKWAKLFPDIQRVRTRSAADVVNEVASVDADFVYFQDSCFGTSMKWLREFSQLYRAKVNIPYHCHLRPNQVSEERVLLLHDSHCHSVRIALETASGKLRKLLNRANYNLLDTSNAVRLLRKWNIKVMIQNMVGLPSGTIEDDLETLDFNLHCRPTYAWVSIYQPYPGTELGDFCKKEGYYSGDYSDLADNFFDTSPLNFSPEYKEQLECLQKVFALCVETGYMPKIEELTHANFEKLVHNILRRQGDRKLYAGVV